MNSFPLTPFLLSLPADGITVTLNDYARIACVLQTGDAWTRARLRGVLQALLTHNPAQIEAFRRRFNAFFPELPNVNSYSREEVQIFLSHLRQLLKANSEETVANKQVAAKHPQSQEEVPGKQSQPQREKDISTAKTWNNTWFARNWPRLAVISALIGMVVVLVIISSSKPKITLTEPTIVIVPQPAISSSPSATPLPTPEEQSSPWIIVAGIILLIFLVGFVSRLLFLQRVIGQEQETAPEFDPNGPRLFQLGQIGGLPAPYLDTATLDGLADSLNYFLSERPSHKLNLPESVRAAGRTGGLPSLVFQKRKKLRKIYIMEDLRAEPLVWNQVAQEMADGLARRGVEVSYGQFDGRPEQFEMRDSSTLWLEDLDAQRRDALLLIFSDGKCLKLRRDRFVLETLSHWPLAAWLDLREQRFWDESARLITHHSIPLYQANANGLVRALGRFLTECGAEQDDAAQVADWTGMLPYGEMLTNLYVENFLGDALTWAQACAMIQPLSNGMADALRCHFKPYLPPERIERLYRLPGSSWNSAGLHFSVPVRKILCEGFEVRWESEEQKGVLEFILEQIRIQEPPEKDSLRYFAWEWAFERVRLNLDPDKALARIALLEQTPLGQEIKRELTIAGKYKLLQARSPDGADIVSSLIRALSDSEPAVRRQAAYTLWSLGMAARNALPALLKSLRDEDPSVRSCVANIIERIGPAQQSVLPMLIKIIKEDNVLARSYASHAAGQIGTKAQEAVPALKLALTDSNILPRIYAAQALGRIGPAAKDAVPLLEKALEDKFICVRDTAKSALKSINYVSNLTEPDNLLIRYIDAHPMNFLLYYTLFVGVLVLILGLR